MDGQRTDSCVPPRVSSMWMSAALGDVAAAVTASVAVAAGANSKGMNCSDVALGCATAGGLRATVLGLELESS